jgi:rubrerythrin
MDSIRHVTRRKIDKVKETKATSTSQAAPRRRRHPSANDASSPGVEFADHVAAAEAETIHALAHLRNAELVGSTVENLRHAVEGETYEYTQMYAPMTAQAQSEGHESRLMFHYAEQPEKVHAELYQKALESAAAGQDLPTGQLFLCPVCGHLERGTPPANCPICSTVGNRYQSIS